MTIEITPAETTQDLIPPPSDLRPWGFHAIMDCSGVNLDKITDAANIKNWLGDLLEKIDMEPVGSPIVELTGVGQPDKEGYTAVQIIVTSSIIAHFINRDRHIYIDVFSCKEFDPAVVEQSIRNFFGSETVIKKILIPRNATA
jgi:S-adenosylmethionine/arginine decarboxylase-like enzyme